MAKQTKITRSAKGEECQIRIPEICNFNPETTVLCHLNGGGGGMKNPDWMASYGCSDCHDVVDGRRILTTNTDLILCYFYEGVMRTQKILIEKGLIVIKS